MILDLSAILKNEGASLEFSDIEPNLQSFELSGEQYSFAKPVKFSGIFTHEGRGIIHLKAHCSYTLNVRCALCAVPFPKEYQIEIDEILRDDNGVSLLVDGKLEIDEIIMADILLNLELKHLCREDCKGLCPVCGANLNEGDCGCDRHVYDPRLSALRDLLK